jgi:hypothetical protein
MESDLAARRERLAVANEYWRCDRLPDSATMARVYAMRVLAERQNRLRVFSWHVRYFAFSTYYGIRLGHAELAEAFLKTSSNREKNCIVIYEVKK